MASKMPRIVIIGAGMAGLTAANKLYTSTISGHHFELCVVEGGSRIGGRINSSEFSGDRIELGATWIHGIEGSPVHRIAQERGLLTSKQPWECMGGLPTNPLTVAEGGHRLSPSFVHPISALFKNLMNSIEGKTVDDTFPEIVKQNGGNLSVGSFLRKGLVAYRNEFENSVKGVGNWGEKSLVEGVFATNENFHRSYSAVDDLDTLDCVVEREYKTFPGEDITIARGYSQVIESLASHLPEGTIQLGRKVSKIEWHESAVKLHFCDGSSLSADHVIVTVSLGVLKQSSSVMFNPPLPSPKIGAISRLGFGVLNKVFLQLPPPSDDHSQFPFLQMVFHPPNSDLKNPEIPDWIRNTSWCYPIYSNSRVVLAWFAGKEAIQIESLTEEEIIDGFSATASNLLSSRLNFEKVVRTQWRSDPLFLGSYSHVPVGSSGDDMDTLSEPLPELKVLFAGEATDRTYYGTTHAAFISGLREANRLLKHYNISVEE